ncbi:MAG TPA: ATP-binding protein [Candidatus Limnocylindrales bacterium]|nr:ATP-binding protein [Candidatus Limnocylindrales bacterium]
MSVVRRSLPQPSPGSAPARSGERVQPADGSPRILLVDDNDGARYAARRTLEQAGFVVLEASTGEGALALAQEPLDAIILDVHLPDADGRELASRLRSSSPGRLPILQVSATSIDPTSQVAGLEAGADAYLPGPTDPAVLVATVRAHLRAARAESAADARSVQWQATFDSISDGVVLLDDDGRIVRLNRAAEEMLATSPVNAAGRRLRALIDLEDLDDPALITSSERVKLEATTGTRWLRLAFDPMTEPTGERTGTVAVISDITERKEMDLALAKALQQQHEASAELARASAAEQAYRKLLEAVVNEMPVGVIVADAPSGRIVIDNAEMGRIMSRTGDPSDTASTRAYRAFHADGRPYRTDEWPLNRSAADGVTVRDEELDVEREDGSKATISVSSMPIRAEDGTIVAAVATVNDITKRREAEHLRDAFIGVLSHELRTPITSIFGGSKVLLRDGGEVDDTVRRGILQDLADESERLNRMVENLLVLARVERGVPLSGQEPILLQRLLPRIVNEEARQWPGLDLRLVVPDDVPTVAGDESYVDQVLRNLVSNAGKYGPTTGVVTIEVRIPDDGHEAEVAVLDEGAGIDESEAGRLFDLFFRSSAVSNKTAGSGIGLFVSRHLVEGMGGRMWARSRPEGGSEFGFSLPAYEVA